MTTSTGSDGKTVCIIGNYSGRNAGDAAMLEGIMLDIRERFGTNVRFTVPTINPKFVETAYKGLNAKPIPILPWNASLKMLGIPVFRAMREADLILVTDAILFDHALANPFKNYLSSLAVMLPLARRSGVPVVLYNCSIGPVSTRPGLWCLKRVLNATNNVILRDEISRRTLARLGLTPNVHTGGDSALGATAASDEQIARVLDENGVAATHKRVIGFNMNAYGSAYLRREHAHLRPKMVIPMLAETIRWMKVELGVDVWIFCTQHMDEPLCRQLQEAVGASDVPLFSNRRYGHRILLGLMSKLSMMVGMRTHSLILASSWGMPLVGMITYPKTLGYLERVGQQARTIPITQLTHGRLRDTIAEAWGNRAAIADEVGAASADQRRLSRLAVEHLRPFLEPAPAAEPVPAPLPQYVPSHV